jgi:hypothetical protein
LTTHCASLVSFLTLYNSLSGIVTSIHNDNQKAVINLVILLSDNGSNIKSQLGAFKNQISIADDYEKKRNTRMLC